jgi:hypothetical protein
MPAARYVDMADAGTLTVGCATCCHVWAPEDQPSVAAAIRKYGTLCCAISHKVVVSGNGR